MTDRDFEAEAEAQFQYFSGLGDWFARRHPATARQLGLGGGPPVDPDVRLLMGGAAVMAADVLRHMQRPWDDLAGAALALVRPLFAVRVPAFAVVRVRPDNPSQPVRLPAGVEVRPDYNNDVPEAIRDLWQGIVFTTACAAELWAARTVAAEITTAPPAGLPDMPAARAWLTVTVASDAPLATLAAAGLERLRFFLGSQGTDRGQALFRTLVGDALGMFTDTPDGWAAASIRPAAEPAVPDDRLWPKNRAVDDRLLAEAGLFPEKRLFVDLVPAPGWAVGTTLRAAVPLARDPGLTVSPADFALGCLPALNLVERTSPAVTVSAGRSAVPLCIESRPKPLEVALVVRVEQTNGSACPQYYGGGYSSDGPFWVLDRGDPNSPRTREQADLLRMVDAGGLPAGRDLKLAVTAKCGHGDVPYNAYRQYQPRWRVSGQPAELVTAPTRVKPPPTGAAARALLPTALTVGGVAMAEPGNAAAVLERLLSVLPGDRLGVTVHALTVEAVRRVEMVEGVASLRRGRRVAVELSGPGAYPFAVILDEYLRATTDPGTYTETAATVYDRRLADGSPDPATGWGYQLPPGGPVLEGRL